MQEPSEYSGALAFFAKAITESKEFGDRMETRRGRITNKATKNLYSQADVERAYDYPIFASEDWLAYRSVMHFYLREHRQALSDLQTLEKILVLHKKNYFDPDSELKFDPSLTQEIYEFRFSPMTFNECYYNMIICLLMVS